MSVVASDKDTLWQYAEDVLATAETALGGTSGGVPELVYTDAGTAPAYDCCPALIVHIPALGEAPTSPNVPIEATARRPVIAGMILATYVVTILRCSAPMGANGNAPSAAEKIAVARETQEDVWVVWNALRQAVRDGDIFTTCEGVHFDGARPVPDQGQCVGWTITIRAMIPGILV